LTAPYSQTTLLLENASPVKKRNYDESKRKGRQVAVLSKFKLTLLIVNIAAAMFMFLVFRYIFNDSFFTNSSGIVYGASFPDLNVDVYSELETELEAHVHSRNAVLKVRDAGSNVKTQAKQIQELAESGAETIFVCPVKSEGLDEALKKSREMGCRIITLGNIYKSCENIDHAISSENHEAGLQMASCLKGAMDHGKILIVGEEDSELSYERMTGFSDYFLSDDDYDATEVVLTNGKSEAVMDVLIEKMKSSGRYDAIFATSDSIGMGAYAVLKELGYAEQTMIFTVDGSPDGRKMVKAGRFYASSGIYPSEIAKRAVELSFSDGSDSHEDIERIPVRLITKTTISSYDLSKWK
jgi:ribose transport system substrate-binding protein